MKTIKWNNALKESLLSYIHESAKKRDDARQATIDAQREFLKSGHKGEASQLTGVTVKELEDAAKYFKTDRKLNEVIDAMIKYRMEVDRDKRLPPTRSGSKGDEE